MADERDHPTVSGVRPYLLTGGRVRPVARHLPIEAQLMTTPAGQSASGRLTYEHRDIVELCRRPYSVAEVAAHLGLHTGVVRVLAGDLIGLGYLTVHAQPRMTGRREREVIIERVIRGLRAI